MTRGWWEEDAQPSDLRFSGYHYTSDYLFSNGIKEGGLITVLHTDENLPHINEDNELQDQLDVGLGELDFTDAGLDNFLQALRDEKGMPSELCQIISSKICFEAACRPESDLIIITVIPPHSRRSPSQLQIYYESNGWKVYLAK